MADAAQLQILQHSIGADKHGRIVRGGGRNHFVTGEGSTDHPHCVALVAAGLMRRRAGSAISGGDDIFHVTDAGKRYVAEHSPPAPKLTRSQRRFEDFLDADCGLTFGEYLRSLKGTKHAHASPATTTPNLSNQRENSL